MELSFPEVLLILAIALIVLGPQDLLKTSQQIGRWMGKLKTELNNVKVVLTEEVLMAERKKLEEALRIKNPLESTPQQAAPLPEITTLTNPQSPAHEPAAPLSPLPEPFEKDHKDG